jgi:molybdenum cofactor biosynthesis protein B
VARDLGPDEAELITARLEQWLGNQRIQAVLTTGGTGIARRDNTIEVVRGLLTMEIEGFGEIFRMLSFNKIKAAAMLSRAVGGLVARDADAGGDTFLFAMPGSTDAVETAVRELIAPQLAHLVWLRSR